MRQSVGLATLPLPSAVAVYLWTLASTFPVAFTVYNENIFTFSSFGRNRLLRVLARLKLTLPNLPESEFHLRSWRMSFIHCPGKRVHGAPKEVFTSKITVSRNGKYRVIQILCAHADGCRSRPCLGLPTGRLAGHQTDAASEHSFCYFSLFSE